MKKLFGNTSGLKANQARRLEKFYRRRIPAAFLITRELTRDLCSLSREIRRQIGVLINRQGKIAFVIVGDHKKIVIPSLENYRGASGRLKGLRCIHTHLQNEALTSDDLTDLSLLRLDMMAAIETSGDGRPIEVHVAHLLPKRQQRKPYQILPALLPGQLDMDCLAFIQALETELARKTAGHIANTGNERALLVSISANSRK